MTKTHRFRPAVLIFAAAMAGSILFASINDENIDERSSYSSSSSSSSLRRHRRQLLSLIQYADPKSVTLKSDAPRTNMEKPTDEEAGVPFDDSPLAFRNDEYSHAAAGGENAEERASTGTPVEERDGVPFDDSPLPFSDEEYINAGGGGGNVEERASTGTPEDEGVRVPYDALPISDEEYINAGGGGVGGGGRGRGKAAIEPAREKFIPVDYESRKNCQIVYIIGVEGATHHGVLPVIKALAKNQIDPETGLEYVVWAKPKHLKTGLFGWGSRQKLSTWGFDNLPDVDDPAFVQRVVKESCPNDGRKHVLIEWTSFPSGQEDDRRTYRVPRSNEWLKMTPEQIANTEEALGHPTNMNAFYQAYAPYVDIKFVVLHRPFLETISSHPDWDNGPVTHSNIIRGFMLMLRRFLDTHLYDLVTGRRLWSLVCVEHLTAKNHQTESDLLVARQHVMSYLTAFFDWPNENCPQCFDDWIDSTKDPWEILGEENVKVLDVHMAFLVGVWPPPGEEGILEQQCRI
ncbi:hypothetical protein ACHAW5_001446 [Stephanodiscus triporus]|uniref:Uncharacterized protein n=1 Tax=Stephanodiscus triporus TaxID=2934178 RepID=A0ABD3MXK3_9STRA